VYNVGTTKKLIRKHPGSSQPTQTSAEHLASQRSNEAAAEAEMFLSENWVSQILGVKKYLIPIYSNVFIGHFIPTQQCFVHC
jgi:hypothetical protein